MRITRFSNLFPLFQLLWSTKHIEREKFSTDIVSTEVDEVDYAANPSLDTTPLCQSASCEHAFVVAPSEVQTSNPSLLSVNPNNSESLSLNPIGDDQERRCTSRVRNKLYRFVFSSILFTLFLTVSYHRLSKSHLAFALHLTYVSS